jgi:hypothetical protein
MPAYRPGYTPSRGVALLVVKCDLNAGAYAERVEDGTDEAELAEIRRACVSALTAIRDMADPHAAVDAAGRLADVIRDAGSHAAQVRAESVRRLQEAEHMSLAELARRIGVSKARANPLVRAATGASPRGGTGDLGPAHAADGKSVGQGTERDDAGPQGDLRQRKSPGSPPAKRA